MQISPIRKHLRPDASRTGGTPVSRLLYCLVGTVMLLGASPAGDAPLYSNDFSAVSPGKLPEDQFLALAGEFTAKDVDGNRVVELAGTPFDSFGVLFGPTPETAACTVSARIWAATTGRRFPEFGVGANDTGGYKLWLMPRTKQVAIRKADQFVATAPYEPWQTGTWTRFRLQLSKAGDGAAWTVRGKVWPDGKEEPKEWTVSFDNIEEPSPGRPNLWANTYSGQPVRFDDLTLER
jgi:hypothetical protein